MKKKTVIMNFSGIYEEETFYKDREVCWIDCRDMSGVNGYCSDDAQEEIRKRIWDYDYRGIHFLDSGNYHYLSKFWLEKIEDGVNGYCSDDAQEEIRKRIWDYDYRGIHFLDSGNYHYLSKFWLEKIEEPYSLVVFDHHTDMQESAFFGMLSCGSWIKEALEEHPYIKEVCVVGPPKAATEQCEPNLASRVVFLTQEELKAGTLEKWHEFLENGKEFPVYLSIDKVICPLTKMYSARKMLGQTGIRGK